MPTYEYSREDGTVFDYFQGINDAALDVCPTTGQKVKRIISGGTGVIYKGDGWYVTDYKNKSSNGSGNLNTNGKSSTDTGTGAGKDVSSDVSQATTATEKTPGSSGGSVERN